MPFAAYSPAARSEIGIPHFTGRHSTTRHAHHARHALRDEVEARRSDHGPVCPNPEMLAVNESRVDGETAANPSPRRSTTPGLKFSTGHRPR